MSMVGRKGTIITVFSTAYAVGKTLIAINMAAELAKSRHTVCLIDLDLQFGDVASGAQAHAGEDDRRRGEIHARASG